MFVSDKTDVALPPSWEKQGPLAFLAKSKTKLWAGVEVIKANIRGQRAMINKSENC